MITTRNTKVHSPGSTHIRPGAIRLHGQEIWCKILYQDDFYPAQLARSNIMQLDGNTIRLYKLTLSIYSGQSFYAEDVAGADRRALEYWAHFLAYLEAELRITLVKPRARNIKIVNAHYAQGDSETYDHAAERGARIWIYAAEDGKLCYITDNSGAAREDETLHPETGRQDREIFDKQYNDWRLYDPPTNSELAQHIAAVTANQEMFAQNLQTHIAAIKELAAATRELRAEIRGTQLIRSKQTIMEDW